MKTDRRHFLGTVAAACIASTALAQAQGYPNRPLHIIVPVPPGGLTDTLARTLGQHLNDALGQPVVVENKPGAGSIIGTDYVLKQPADGYNILLTWTAIVQNPLLYDTAKYDPVKDFVPVARLGSISTLFVAANHLKVSNLKEFIAYAKASPKPVNYGTPGVGSASNFYGEIISKTLGIQLNHVPYKGDADMLPDLLNQRVDAVFIQPGTADAYAKDGKIKLLAVSGPKRIQLMPQVPTFAEQGVAGLDDDRWFGIFMRAGTPQAIVDRISSEVGKWVALPATQERMKANAMDPGATNSAEFTATVAKSAAQWRDIVKRVPIKLQ